MSMLNTTSFFIRVITFSLVIAGFASCSQDERMFELRSSADTGIFFQNIITSNDSINLLNFEYFYNGGGVAVGDFNNDGLQDIYFTGNMVSGKLYLNKGNLKFEDATKEAGVETINWATGVSIVDINNDGLQDIYVCMSGYKDPVRRKNRLFINKGIGQDNIPKFEEESEKYGLADSGYTTQAMFFDYDRDGDLDVYLATVNRSNTNPNVIASKSHGKGGNTSIDRLYRNNGDNTFSNVSEEAGITNEGYGLGVGVGDINQDGWPDIYVTNDFIYDDLLYINNQDGTFTESIRQYLKHTSHFSMGTDVADFNNDGLLDIISVDMMPDDSRRQKLMNGVKNYDQFQLTLQRGYVPQYVRNNLQLNNGNGTFSEISQLAGVHYTDWSWSPLFADFDNDGKKDLFITNGIRKDITHLDFATYYLMQARSSFGNKDTEKHLIKIAETMEGSKKHNFMFRNNGDLTFTDESANWGFEKESYSSGAAYADLDNDGDLDIVINNVDEEPLVYQNMLTEREKRTGKDQVSGSGKSHFLRIKFEDLATNKAGIGARATLRYDDKMQLAELYPYRGFQSTVENALHFGVGPTERIDEVEITWPDGKSQVLKDVKPNQVLSVSYVNAKAKAEVNNPNIITTLFKDVTAELGISYKDKNHEYVDFKLQPLLPHKYSQNGPGISVGDVNGDGLEDFYVGGSATFSGVLFLQSKDGEFLSKPLSTEDKLGDDMGSLFFDADGDGDLDLYVVSGGSEYYTGDKAYQDRLYLNDGRGNFKLDATALPLIDASGSCVVAADYDHDGDLDLFVGGRVNPRAFPLPAKSYILQNNGGKFKDVTSIVCSNLTNVGMVTSAIWTDFDNDNAIDLVVVGEFMSITFFRNENGKLKNVTINTGLEETNGWWNSLAAGDFDNDGDVDFVAGNLGLNSKFKASKEQPVQVYAKDFDKSGSTDAIMTHYIQGKKQLVHGRDNLTDQMVSLRREFRSYEDYASKSFDEIFTSERLEGAYVIKSENFRSSYIENLGGGKFRMTALPMQAQFAPVNGITVNDYDRDGNLDILLTGNSYATEVVVGRYDAFTGLYLKGNGKGQFLPVDANNSGFKVDTDAKGMAEINIGSGVPHILVASYNENLKAYKRSVKKDALQAIDVVASDAYAVISFGDGKRRKQEFYFGSGYLSQSSRILWVPASATSVKITDGRGKSRTVNIAPKPERLLAEDRKNNR